MLKIPLFLFALFPMAFCSCPTGWDDLPGQAGCYYIDLRPMNFLYAERACQEMQPDAHLLSLHNGFQNEIIRDVLTGNVSIEALWIGLNKLLSGQWEWIDGSLMNFNRTCHNFPTSNTNDCIKFTELGCWLDADCSELTKFACGTLAGVTTITPTLSQTTITSLIPLTTTTTNADGCNLGFTLMEDGYCYYASDVSMTFANANIDCRSRGAELVSMHSYWENVIAVKFVQYAREVLHKSADRLIWIGLQCSNASLSSCAWTDGSRFDYSAWYRGSYWGVMFSYAVVRGRWRANADTSNLPFICKHRGAVGVFEPSDSQLPQCNIGFWPIDGNNSCYGFDSSVQNSWSSCDSMCVQSGGRCASMQKREENVELYALFQRTQPPMDLSKGYHIGLKENAGTWQWVDGSFYGNAFWDNSYPRPGQTPYISAATNGLWQTGSDEGRSAACRQKPIYQKSNAICPAGTYFGMGEIRSPGFPHSYAANLTCTYALYDRIVADPEIYMAVWGPELRTKLAIYFTAFDIHPSDVVEIFDGSSTNSPRIATISGTTGAKQEYYSTGYNMTIRFTSTVGNGYKGWRALFGPYTTEP